MSENIEKKDFFLSSAKGIGIMIISVLLGILIFAGVVKFACLSDKVIKPINQFIKALSIFLGCLSSIKNNKGLLKGLITGGIGMIIIYLIFAIIGGGLSFGLAFFIDLLFGVIVGGISGILSVSLKKRNRE